MFFLDGNVEQMNLIRMHRCGNVNCLSQQKESIDDNNKTTFTRRVYQVHATTICRLVKQNENKCLYKSFGQLLYLSSIDRLSRKCNHQQDDLLLINAPDLISVAIHWNSSECTTSDVEDFVSTIEPFIHLKELFYDVAISEARTKQLNLIGLICFYGNTIEVFFSYEHTTSKWLFCFDGNITIANDWNAVRRKCIDFHLQPFLLIYANAQQNPVDISQLLKRTVIQEKIASSIQRTQSTKASMSKNDQYTSNPSDLHSLENLSKISSFATLNSSMLFMPKPSATSSYINQETVAKVMQQQLLKKESLYDTTSSLSFSQQSSSLSPTDTRQKQLQIKQRFDDTLSSRDSSTSSQRDSGLSSGINDGSSDDSPIDSPVQSEQIEIDSLIKQTEQIMNDSHVDMSLASIEHYLEQSLKYESASNYSSALDCCQRALLLVDQILSLSLNRHNRLSIYARTRKNSLLIRMRSLRKRQIECEESNQTLTNMYKSLDNMDKNNDYMTTSILSSTKRLIRPKKNVKFSDNVALIVPTSEDIVEPPSEHLIHSFLRKIHQQSTTSDSDSDTQSLSTETPIGLIECSLCYKRFSKTNQSETYCSNCQFYMKRFQPTTS